ncbi:MAG TPA: ECF-type sigma factor [Pirellulales bacterium]
MESHSVTRWIAQVKAGESLAAQRIFERYLSRLVQIARLRLVGSPQQVADSDDAVIVAFEKFLRYAKEGRFPQLDDRFDLWQVLLLVTDQTAIDQRRRMSAEKRTANLASFSTMDHHDEDHSESPWQPASPDPTPDFAVATAEQCRRLLGLLDDGLRRIAVAKVHGLTNTEISQQEKLSLRGVERKLHIIRKIWSAEINT